MKKLSIALAAVLAMAGAQASTITQTGSTALSPTDLNSTSIGTFNLFDTTLGTLTGVTIDLTGLLQGTINLSYGAAAAATNIRGTTTSDLFFGSSNSGIAAALSGVDINLTYNTGLRLMNPNSTYASGPLSTSASNPTLSPLASLFSGPGTFGLNCSSLTAFSVAGGGGFSGGSQTTFGQCGATIVYTYTPTTTTVPEPSSLALVGLALAGAGLVARRKA